jgi:hypothetical protein
MEHSYRSALGPIPIDWFGNDGDPAIPIDTGEGSVVAHIIKRIQLSEGERPQSQNERRTKDR